MIVLDTDLNGLDKDRTPAVRQAGARGVCGDAGWSSRFFMPAKSVQAFAMTRERLIISNILPSSD